MSEVFPEANNHEIVVVPKLVIEKHKVDSEGFIEEIEKFLSSGKHIWRSSAKLATHFNVDSVELDQFLLKSDKIVSKSINEEGFYALKSRLEQKVEKPRPVITEQDRYALAQICAARDLLEKALKKYGADIQSKSPEAFAYFVEGKSKLDVGIVYFANSTKSNLERL